MIYNHQQTEWLMKHLIREAQHHFPAGGLIRICLPKGIVLSDIVYIDRRQKCRRGGKRLLALMCDWKYDGELCGTYICLEHQGPGYARLVLTNRRSRLVEIPKDLAMQSLFDVVDSRD